MCRRSGTNLLSVCFQLAIQLRIPQDGLGALLLRLERLYTFSAADAQFHETGPLLISHLVHARFQLLHAQPHVTNTAPVGRTGSLNFVK